MTLAPASKPKEDAEPAASPRSETLELLPGYLAKIGKDSLLTDRQEVILSRKARAGDQKAKKKLIDMISPEDFVVQAQEWLEKGAQLIGGCCGIGPEHIQLLKERLPEHVPAGD